MNPILHRRTCGPRQYIRNYSLPTLECLNLWWPKVKSCGILAGHDYARKKDDHGVKRAIDEFAKRQELTVVTNSFGGQGRGWVF